jgi:hypothetical protein
MNLKVKLRKKILKITNGNVKIKNTLSKAKNKREVKMKPLIKKSL